MKKILAILLATLMVAALSVTAFAADGVTPPTAITPLVSNGSPLTLINAGTADSDSITFKYAVKGPSDSDYGTASETIPTGTEAGEYSIRWTAVEIDAMSIENEVDSGTLTVTISTSEPDAPAAEAPAPMDTPDGQTTPLNPNQTHTITINNADQNVDHQYKAYQVFKGDLNDDETILSNIAWGAGVNGSAITTILNTAIANGTKPDYLDNDEWTAFVTAAKGYADAQKPADWVDAEDGPWSWTFTTAAEVADFISTFTSTNGDTSRNHDGITVDTGTENAGLIDTFAAIAAANVATVAGTSAQDKDDPTVYTIPVTGDGYYLVIDVTTTLNNADTLASDTVSKYLLQVIRDREINAKDTGLNPDKKILNENNVRVAADSANIGDVVTFSVEITVPDTKKYVDHFVFVMDDQLPEGITYSDDVEVKIGTTTVPTDNYTVYVGSAVAKELTNYQAQNAYFTAKGLDPTKVNNETPNKDELEKFVNADGKQAIKIVFNDFKDYVEAAPAKIGQKMTITYTGVVNKKATFGPNGNENEVEFEYSNNPNHDYDGDTPDSDDPVGITPKSKTKTYVTTLKLNKKDGDTGSALEGAEFKITYNNVEFYKLTGERFVESTDDEYATVKVDSEKGITAVVEGYWALVDGTYTTTDPETAGMNDTQYKKNGSDYVTAKKISYTKYVEGEPAENSINVITDGSGVIHVEGVSKGTYSIVETKAPDGYNTLKEGLAVEIGWIDPAFETSTVEAEATAWAALTDEQKADAKKSGGFYIINQSEGIAFTFNNAAGTMAWEIRIDNFSGTELPSTGGIGTTIFYIVGGLLAVGAGVVLVAKKRMGKEDL